ncbi:MAG: hypothetical protein ABJR46_09480 [Tateyamaria sp.]|uniref:hypothetical protein n=1 Tax=Tateyamaria sp. TaxID=1929288 RepID=UPI0032853787
MSATSSVRKSVEFPTINQETLSRLSAEADDLLASRTRKVQHVKTNWFTSIMETPIFEKSWPFK